MKNFKKLLLTSVSALLVATNVAAFTACEKPGNKIPDSVDVVAYDGSAVTVTFYHSMGADLRKILDTYIADFNAVYPNITIKHDSFGDYDGTRDQIKTELNNGNSPTIAYCYPDHVALYNNAKAVMTLDGYIDSTLAATQSDWSPEGTLGFTATQKADFIQAYYNEGKSFGDGLMYTLPYQKSTEVLYYNKTLFEQKGYEVPTTWEAMEDLCEQIKKDFPKDIPLGYDSEANLFINLAEQYKSPYTTATKGEHFKFNNEVNRGFAQMLRDWYNKGYLLTKQTYSGKYMSDLFKATGANDQKAYMCIGSTGGATYQGPAKNNDETYPFEVGVAPIPQVDPANAKVISQGPSLCMFKKSAQECAAGWLFLKFLTTYVPLQAESSMNNGYTPVINSVFENETFKADFLDKADGNAYLQATVIKQMIKPELQSTFFTSPAFNGSSAARDEVGTLITNVLLKKDSSIQSLFDEAIENLAYDYGY